MRSNQTDAEKKIWEIIRAKRLGYKFKRQYSIDNRYIADFVCLEKRLIIEIDGGQHADNKEDKIRTAYLEKQGFKEIRFWNNEVLNNLDGCYQKIVNELET